MRLGRRFDSTRLSLLVIVLALCDDRLAIAAPPPAPWVSQDIGAPSPAGQATFDQGAFIVTASGKDIWSTSDQFHFVYQQISGDVAIVARVDSLVPVNPSTKVGVMIRGSLSANAPYAYALSSASNGLTFQQRPTAGAKSTKSGSYAAGSRPWVRLVRSATRITAYTSPDGAKWTTLATATVSMGTTAYVGLAVTGPVPGTLTTAGLSNVSVLLPEALPSPQKVADIGGPAIKGSTSYRQGTYTIAAGGTDIGGTSDQFHFVYQPVSGDAEIIARVTEIGNANSGSKAGVMVRESLAANSRHAFMYATAGTGFGFRRRIDPGGFTPGTTSGTGAVTGWVRLVRTGNRFEAFRSADGNVWTSLGSDTVPMGSDVYIGLAVSSRKGSVATQAIVDNLQIPGTSGSTNQPPTVNLTSPTSGTTLTPPASMTVSASAADLENRLARVEFYWGALLIGTDTTAPYDMTWSSVAAGTYSLTAKAYDSDGGSATSPAVTVEVSSANQLPSVTLTAPVGGATYTPAATVAVSASASDPEGRLARVEFYADGTLIATDTTEPYSASWSATTAGTYALKAIAYDEDEANKSSAVVTVTVIAVPPPTPPKYVMFQASADHSTTLVTNYLLEIFANGANPQTATPIASSDLGKSAPAANGDVTVDRATLFSALQPGTYIASVSAIGPGGKTATPPVTFTR